MQLNSDIGPIFTQQQTETPFTGEVRMFNLKEANSTGNCIGDMCSSKVAVSNYTKDVEQSLKKFLKDFDRTVKTFDSRDGIYNVENFENENLSRTMKPEENREESKYETGSFVKNTPFIAEDDRYADPTNPDVVNNAEPKDYTYNSYADWRAPTFNQWTKIHDDNCNEENRLKIASKPMKYYVNQFNSPQSTSFMEYSIIGNQKQYDVRNEFERAIPTRLNPLYPVPTEPYLTTPFLGANNPDRVYAETSEALRWSKEIGIRNKKTQNENSEKNYNRWDFVSPKTVQNAGQFNTKVQSPGRDGYYDYSGEDHVIFGNGATPYWGLSSRNLLRNFSDLSGC